MQFWELNFDLKKRRLVGVGERIHIVYIHTHKIWRNVQKGHHIICGFIYISDANQMIFIHIFGRYCRGRCIANNIRVDCVRLISKIENFE